jgi:hypothetical protein
MPAAPSSRPTCARKTDATLGTKKGMAQATKTAGLPRAPRTSAVTLTINEEVKTSYADVLATARQKVPLAEIGVESLVMRKSMTRGIIIRLPGDKDRGKASRSGDASGGGAGPGRGESSVPEQDGGVEGGRDRHLGR